MSTFLYFCQIDFNIAISIIILSLIFLMVKGYEKMQDSKAIKECLDKLLSANDRVFIVPHNRPDMDAIGASIGMALICKKNKKRCFIVVDDDLEKIEISTRKIIEEINNDYEIIQNIESHENQNIKTAYKYYMPFFMKNKIILQTLFSGSPGRGPDKVRERPAACLLVLWLRLLYHQKFQSYP